MRLEKEKKDLVINNQGLVNHQLWKFEITFKNSHYNDLVSTGNLALTKAAITFDPSKKFVFATYASCCIANEIRMYFRKENKYEKNISIEEIITESDKGNGLKVEDVLKDPYNLEEKIIEKTEYVRLMNIILNCLDGKERLVLLYLIAEKPQKEIVENLGISQSYISRLQKRAIRKTKEIALEEQKYQSKINVEISQNSEYEYEIIFGLKNIVRDKEKIQKISKCIKNMKKKFYFQIEYQKGNVKIQIFPYPEAINLLAKFIQKMEEM